MCVCVKLAGAMQPIHPLTPKLPSPPSSGARGAWGSRPGGRRRVAVARRARGWFHGQNSLGLPLIDARGGACCDGLQPSGVNRNQGAESTLSYLWVEMQHGEAQPALSAASRAAAASA